MNILITNILLSGTSGTEMYVKELAIELVKRGHTVEVFCLFLGETANDLINSNINVTDDLAMLKERPDIIHAHHNVPALRAILFFKNTPVVNFVHNRTSIIDYPFLHRNIIKYVAVDYNCKETYCIDCGFNENDVEVIYNWVNTDRFQLKSVINSSPKKALVFSHYIDKSKLFSEIENACMELGIALDLVGKLSGNANNTPERILGNYDLVFGKAKAGMEAMASGTSLIVCDVRGLGAMVTPSNIEHFRLYNFGMKLMTKEVTKKSLIEEIKKYDVEHIKEVSAFVRLNSSLTAIVDQLEDAYKINIDEFKKNKRGIHKYSLFNHLYIRIFTSRDIFYLFLKIKHPKILSFFKPAFKIINV